MVQRTRLIVFAAAAASIGFQWCTDVPLGLPGEWTWNRIPHDDAVLSALGAIQAIFLFAFLALVSWAGWNRIADASRPEVVGWLAGLIIAGFAWLHAVQDAPPDGTNSAKIPFVLYYPSSSGYFHKARFGVEDTAQFLGEYESIVREGDVLHEGTHPPGLIVFYRGLLTISEKFPSVVALPDLIQPQSATDALDLIQEATLNRADSITTTDRSVIWLAGMLTQLAAALVVVPLFGLIRLVADRQTAWRTICFWPLVPAVAIFIPKSDVLFAFGSTVLVCCWLYAVRSTARPGAIATPLLLGALAGTIGWFGLFCSLAFLPIGAIAVMASLLMFGESKGTNVTEASTSPLRMALRRHLWPTVGGAAAFIAITIMIAAVWKLHLPRVWYQNYLNHSRFYEVSPKSYLGWLLVNPLELMLALGAPLTVVMLNGFARLATSNTQDKGSDPRRKWLTQQSAPIIAVGVIWGFLWLTGKNSGEAARLWIPLMPLALWATASGWSFSKARNSSVPGPSNRHEHTREWLIVMLAQMLVCLATVLSVSGFLEEQNLN